MAQSADLVKGSPPRVGGTRAFTGGVAARVLGLIDGWFGSSDRMTAELDKFKCKFF